VIGPGAKKGDPGEGIPGLRFLEELSQVIDRRHVERPADSYTAQLFEGGIKRISQKFGEEAVEVVIAAQSGDRVELTRECADVLFSLMVLLRARSIGLEDVVRELETRHRRDG
jgi:phosphoribosyl-ATP pyrophosphohydrolase/phosphoribosyl-AMP cyclohydrolase